MKLSAQQFEECKNNNDAWELVHLQGNFYARCGTSGITILDKKQNFKIISHCNSFREKTLNEVNEILST